MDILSLMAVNAIGGGSSSVDEEQIRNAFGAGFAGSQPLALNLENLDWELKTTEGLEYYEANFDVEQPELILIYLMCGKNLIGIGHIEGGSGLLCSDAYDSSSVYCVCDFDSKKITILKSFLNPTALIGLNLYAFSSFSPIDQLWLDSTVEPMGKITINSNRYTVTRKPLTITNGNTTTTYYIADIT